MSSFERSSLKPKGQRFLDTGPIIGWRRLSPTKVCILNLLVFNRA
jgi:hypothetical protein